MSDTLLQILWYLVVCAAVVFYTVLDGFDLGVGALHLFVKSDSDRRIFLNSIGPIWDGNEVWLVIIGGALLAGFPEAYATIFSAFYVPTMILLCGIVFRVVAIEFRSKHPEKKWRQLWDVVFSIASITIAFGTGVMIGNLIQGIPLNTNKEFVGTFADFISPFPLLVGVLSVLLFMVHGLIYLLMKTEGDLHDRLRKFIMPLMTLFAVFFILTTADTIISSPFMLARFYTYPILYTVPLLAILSMILIPLQVIKKRDGFAFVASSLTITLLFVLFGIGTFPVLLRSSLDPVGSSLTIYNCSSTGSTIKILLCIVLIGLPLVLGYGYLLYRVFRGKVKIDHTSY
jgi:cytochrome d ubiquinol oxidase subunit II